jgi:hypothetical protein
VIFVIYSKMISSAYSTLHDHPKILKRAVHVFKI